MKIKYEFADGTVSEVEVEESIGAIIVEDRRLEENLARKERYHCHSLDAVEFEDMDYAAEGTLETLLAAMEEDRHLYEAFQQLSKVQRRRILMLAGGMTVNNWFLGYTKNEEGKFIIDPDQAEVVRRIYAEYLDSKSLLQIKRGLEADGVSNSAGHKKWYESNIKQILTNEKYIGDALLQKTCTVSILEKKRAKNDGALSKYYVEGCHEAIISRDIFLQVQSEMRRRANLSAVGKKRVCSGKYALSSIVYCAHCGDIYRRIKWNNRGYRSIVWRCVSRVEKGGPDCTARTVREDELHRAVLTATNDVLSRKDSFLPILKENIKAVLGEDITGKVEEIDKEIKLRQAELLRPGNSDKQIEKIGDAITYLRESRQEILTEAALKKDTRDRIEDMMRFLDDQICAVTEYSETLTRRLIEKVMVYDEKMVVEFKSGLQIEVDA